MTADSRNGELTVFREFGHAASEIDSYTRCSECVYDAGHKGEWRNRPEMRMGI